MKFIISESRLENIIFTYLDNQDFIKIKRGNKIYFVNSEGDKYAQIKYDKDDGWCLIYYKLVDEISSFFSLRTHVSKEIIGKWVENTLQMKVSNTFIQSYYFPFIVENTLQMKVSNTNRASVDYRMTVENT